MKFEAESLVVEMAILALFWISEKAEIFDFIQEHIGHFEVFSAHAIFLLKSCFSPKS